MDNRNISHIILIWIIVLTLLGVFVSIICLIAIKDTQKVLNWISYIGSIMTLLGLAVTFYQTTVVERKAKETEDSVRNQIKNTLSIIDITKAKLFVDFIIENMTSEKYEVAYYRMVELNDIMMTLLSDCTLKDQMDSNIDEICIKFTSDMNTVHKFIGDKPLNYDSEIVIANLHRIRTNINKASNYINTLSYGRS